MTIFSAIFYDEETRQYFRWRPDDPSKDLHGISFNAILDLNRHLQRYEQDYYSENPPIV